MLRNFLFSNKKCILAKFNSSLHCPSAAQPAAVSYAASLSILLQVYLPPVLLWCRPSVMPTPIGRVALGNSTVVVVVVDIAVFKAS